jgi:hypothetical protein
VNIGFELEWNKKETKTYNYPIKISSAQATEKARTCRAIIIGGEAIEYASIFQLGERADTPRA